MFNGFLSGNTILPFITDVTHLLAAPTIIRTVALGLIKPWGHPFKVTGKGVSTEAVTVHWRILAPFAIGAVATSAGMLFNLSPFASGSGTSIYGLNIVWSIISVAVLSTICAVCVELPKRRRDERFNSGEQGILVFPHQPAQTCIVVDISVGGSQLFCKKGWNVTESHGMLVLDEGQFQCPFRTNRINSNGCLAVLFIHDDVSRRAFIRKLFSESYNNEVKKVNVIQTFIGALRMVFR